MDGWVDEMGCGIAAQAVSQWLVERRHGEVVHSSKLEECIIGAGCLLVVRRTGYNGATGGGMYSRLW
jgi:hypothetical protein